MMKDEYNKIFWRVGQEITPETFIQADNYITAQQNLIRKFLNRRYYGLLPVDEEAAPSITVSARLNGMDVSIEQLRCQGVTRDGSLITFDGDLSSVVPCRLSLSAFSAGSYYVVLRILPFEQQLVEPVENEETPFALPVWEFDVKDLQHIEGNELPVLKIIYNQQYPEIDRRYIPPCMAVCSNQNLMEQYQQFKQTVADIQSTLIHKREQFSPLIAPITLMLFDLEQISLNEPPWTLIQLLKKTIKIIGFFFKSLQLDPQALHEPYIHDDIMRIIQALTQCFQDIQLFIGKQKAAIQEEEDFTPRI
jgi:predicted component of type VI protein secretion system